MTKSEGNILSRLEGKIDTLNAAVKGNGKGLEERVGEIEKKKVGKTACTLIHETTDHKIDNLDKRDRLIVWLLVVGGFGISGMLVAILKIIVDHAA